MMQALNEHTLQVIESLATRHQFALLPELRGFLSSSLLVMVCAVLHEETINHGIPDLSAWCEVHEARSEMRAP